MARAIEDSGHKVSSPWVLALGEGTSPSALDVFERDRKTVEESDAVVADVTRPSTGVGMEVMAAFYGGKKIVLVMKKGSVVSRMLLHLPKKEVVEFEGDEDLYAGIRLALKTS